LNRSLAVWMTAWHKRLNTTMLEFVGLFALAASAGGLIVAVLRPFDSPVRLLLSLVAFCALGVVVFYIAEHFILRQAQKLLNAQEERLRSMATALPDRVVMLDADGRYHAVLHSPYGSAANNLKGGDEGQRVHDIYPPTFADFCVQKVREVIVTNRNQVFEYDFDWQNRHYRFEGRAIPYVDPLTQEPLVIWVSRDITEREQMENRLSEKDKLLHTVFEALPDRTTIFDVDGRYIEILQTAFYDLHELESIRAVRTGDTIHDHFSAEFADFCLRMIRKTLDSGTMQVFDYPSPDHNPPLYFEARTIPFIDPINGAARVLWIARDITARREAAEHRLALALQQEKLEFFQQFVSNITHDLKTPLALIETGLYFVERTEDASSRQIRIDNIHQQVVTLNRMIDDILTIGRLDAMPALNFEDLDVVALLQETVARLQPQSEKKNQRLSTWVAAESVILPASRTELSRALTNLIDNAIKYTPDQGQIEVDVRVKDTEIVIKIRDTGIGIKAENIPRIFDRFYRSDSGRLTASGTGLGLAIVKRIIELHGGRIEVESEAGQGSTFSIYLPVRPAPVSEG
jgi:signal transduction histidine kinase